MACVRSDAGCRLCLLGLAGTALRRSGLAVAGNHFRSADPHGGLLPPRPSQRNSVSRLCGQCRDHPRHDCFVGFSDPRDPTASRASASPAAFGDRTLDYQRFGVRPLVLEARCWRSAEARPCAWRSKKLVSFPTDVEPGRWGSLLEAPVHGLSLSRLQHQYGFFTDGYSSPLPLGQSGHDGPVLDFSEDRCPPRSASREYSLSPPLSHQAQSPEVKIPKRCRADSCRFPRTLPHVEQFAAGG